MYLYLPITHPMYIQSLREVVLPSIQNIRWVLCHHGMAHPQVADGGEGLQTWRVAANILNKQTRTADNVWSSSLGVRRGANNSSP
jgi:hypothetical protein